jgi:orotate phosphoribosyltransferase
MRTVTREESALEVLGACGALLRDDHFVLTSGRHSREYVNKDAVYLYPFDTHLLCTLIANEFSDDHIEVVVGPAIGGIILSQWVAAALTEVQDPVLNKPVLSVYAERKEKVLVKKGSYTFKSLVTFLFGFNAIAKGIWLEPDKELVMKEPGFILKRGYDKLVAGKRVLIVEDILTTGGTVREVAAAVRSVGGKVMGVGALCNRGRVTAEGLGIPMLQALVNLPIETWTAEECMDHGPCSEHVPFNTSVGKAKDFLVMQGT